MICDPTADLITVGYAKPWRKSALHLVPIHGEGQLQVLIAASGTGDDGSTLTTVHDSNVVGDQAARYLEPVPNSSTFIAPCVATLRDRLPKGEGWLYEVKFNGYRMQVHKAGAYITLYTSNGADWTGRFPHLAEILTSLPCASAIIDAELLHMDGFEELHRRVHERKEDALLLWAFDLMQLNGNDLRAVSLADRKRRLGHLIERARIGRLHHSEIFMDGEILLAECNNRGLEGVVARHKNSIYRSGRSTSWIKVERPKWREANRNRGDLFGESRSPA